MNKIFLGGTCNNSTWRDELTPVLDKLNIRYFNPVVEDWTLKCQAEETRQKEDVCDIHLYVITSEMTGVFSIAEAIDSVWQEGKKCIFFVVSEGFPSSQLKSLGAVVELIIRRDGVAAIIENKNTLNAFIINEYKLLN